MANNVCSASVLRSLYCRPSRSRPLALTLISPSRCILPYFSSPYQPLFWVRPFFVACCAQSLTFILPCGSPYRSHNSRCLGCVPSFVACLCTTHLHSLFLAAARIKELDTQLAKLQGTSLSTIILFVSLPTLWLLSSSQRLHCQPKRVRHCAAGGTSRRQRRQIRSCTIFRFVSAPHRVLSPPH